MPQINSTEWDNFLSTYPDTHILQTQAWGELKSSYGWRVAYFCKNNTGAQVLFKNLPFGFNIAYIPKGPIGPDWKALWQELDINCKKNKTIFLKVEPDLWDTESSSIEPNMDDFKPNASAIQPRRTITIDLINDEQSILSSMKQKTRYNIRLAEKKGVKVYASDDIDTFHKLMLDTSARDKFGVHSKSYYQKIFDSLYDKGECVLLFAEHNNEPLAAIMVVAHGKRAWYFYGASSDSGRNLMPTYLLQWEAIKWAISKGCLEYDLWGIPDEDLDALERDFLKRSDGLWGVYRFKRGFGGTLRRSAGAWDKIYKPLLYNLYILYNNLRHQYYG